MSYLLRRLAACAAQLAAVSLLTFLLFSVIPGDFYSAERWNPQSTSASLDQWRKEQGLDQPWPRRYSTWLRSCARGDFGVSTAYRMPVSRLLAPRLSKTLQAKTNMLVAFAQLADQIEAAKSNGRLAATADALATRRLLEA